MWHACLRARHSVEERGRGCQECVDEVLVDRAASARRLDVLHPPPPLGKVGPGGSWLGLGLGLESQLTLTRLPWNGICL